jgi:hypothetical protein
MIMIMKMEGLRTESHGVYMRCSADTSSDSEHSSLNMWQILPYFVEGRDIFKKVSLKITRFLDNLLL